MNKFFLTGPNRTGTTLLARCIDDHPQCICLFESNIHIKIFGGQGTMSHGGRMIKAHGMNRYQVNDLLQKANGSILNWYDHCAEVLKDLYQKPELTHIGDKNPYFHNNPGACREIAGYPQIWTIRDPRAVWHSHKGKFFPRYLSNVRHFINHNNALIIRFEDLLSKPESTMKLVYNFLGVEYDESFMSRPAKPHDRRFKWNPNAVDPFDESKIDAWRGATEALPKKFFSPLVKQIMKKFDYE